MKKKSIFNLFSYGLIGFVTAIIILNIFESEYKQLKKITRQTFYSISLNKDKDNFDKCLPKVIKTLPNQSLVVIGHAFGSHARKKPIVSNLAPHVDLFLEENKEIISYVVFTGDVFDIPSEIAWKNLYKKYGQFFDIFIAPGDHDVGESSVNAYKDIFNQQVTKKQPKLPIQFINFGGEENKKKK